MNEAAHNPTYTGTLSDPILDTDHDADGVISYGDFIKFTAETNIVGNAPLVEINLRAYQAGVLVSTAWFKPGMDTGLYSPIWRAGGASCTADLGWFDAKQKFHVLDSKAFDVHT